MFKEVKTKKYFAIHSWKLWPKYQNTCRFYFYISWIIVSVLHSVGWEEWEEAQDKLQQKVIILIYLLFFLWRVSENAGAAEVEHHWNSRAGDEKGG